jgi:hypothetical protein
MNIYFACFISPQVSGVNECIPTWDIFTPAWTSASTPFDISENVAIGTTVVTIKATDLDSGLDGDITYEIDSITTGNKMKNKK